MHKMASCSLGSGVRLITPECASGVLSSGSVEVVDSWSSSAFITVSYTPARSRLGTKESDRVCGEERTSNLGHPMLFGSLI
jgi:hypothetical protein